MGKNGFGIFPRRKSAGNAIEEAGADPSVYLNPAPSTESGGFRVLNRADIERAKQEHALKKPEKHSKFGRFSTFGTSGNKGRTQSIDEDSPSSSKRDSKSSSGTQSFMSRQYHPGGSSSTLPSSAESDPNDNNLFSNGPPRPHIPQHNSSPSNMSVGGGRKQLPPVPYPSRSYQSNDPGSAGVGEGRARALTTSSYASTAIAPKLEADLDFGDSAFENMFSGLDRKESPELRNIISPGQAGRSLLQGRRTFQSEPIKIDPHKEIEAPPRSWDSRGSGDNLMESPSEDDRSPPPVPVHKFSQYAPVASHSPPLNGTDGFEDEDAKLVRQSAQSRKSFGETSPNRNNPSGSPMGPAMHIPLSPTSASTNTTPRGVLRTTAASSPMRDEDDTDLFGSPTSRKAAPKKPSLPVLKENVPPSNGPPGGGRVMTAAEFQEHQRLQASQPTNDSSDEEDYEDEEDAIRKQEEEQRMIRQRQQLQIAREHMRRSTAPGAPMATNGVPPLSNGFPSETSLQADEWSDEDVPLGVLAQHGFPSRSKPPTQPPNAGPSYFMSDSPGGLAVPDRPASTGAMGNRASTYRPPFARNLPEDPYATNGLVRQSIREPMGFNRPASLFNEPMVPPMGSIPLDAQPQFTSLVDQIQMRDNAKQKYMGGASAKKPTGGPFTGALAGQMNAPHLDRDTTRMSRVPQMAVNGVPGMNPMMNMMGGPMPMMGMNQMPYPMYPQNELMMQQMYQQMLQMQVQQNAMFGGQQPQDPRMSMFVPQPPLDHRMSMFPGQTPGFQQPQFQNNSLLSVGGGGTQQRPMSIMSFGGAPNQTNLSSRPYSSLGPPGMQAPGGFPSSQAAPMHNGYTPSIAPSERSNIGLSARYRPVVTGNGMADTQSTIGSSMTLQASGGAHDISNSNTNGKTVKGILKNRTVPTVSVVKDDDEDDWGKMAARKSKYMNPAPKKDDGSDGLQDLVRGVEAL